MDLQAVAESRCEHGRAVDVFADVFGAAGIVKNDGEVERVGIGDFVKEAAIDSAARIVLGDELVELFDAAQRVFVGGVAVEKFVLDEAVERAEFRQVTAEKSDAVHEAQHARDITFAFEDRLECFAVGFRATEGPVDVVPVLRDEAADLRAELEVAKLAMLEEPHESMRVLAENFAMGGEKSAIAGDEAVEFFSAFFAEGEERANAGIRARILFELEGLHQRGRVLVDVAGVAVVIPHEGLGATQDVALRVVEGGSDDALELEGELIGGFAAVVVQLVANAMDEVEGGLELAECGCGE